MGRDTRLDENASISAQHTSGFPVACDICYYFLAIGTYKYRANFSLPIPRVIAGIQEFIRLSPPLRNNLDNSTSRTHYEEYE